MILSMNINALFFISVANTVHKKSCLNLTFATFTDMRATTIIPLVCKFCQQAIDSNDVTLPVVAKLIGKICHGLSCKSLVTMSLSI